MSAAWSTRMAAAPATLPALTENNPRAHADFYINTAPETRKSAGSSPLWGSEWRPSMPAPCGFKGIGGRGSVRLVRIDPEHWRPLSKDFEVSASPHGRVRVYELVLDSYRWRLVRLNKHHGLLIAGTLRDGLRSVTGIGGDHFHAPTLIENARRHSSGVAVSDDHYAFATLCFDTRCKLAVVCRTHQRLGGYDSDEHCDRQ